MDDLARRLMESFEPGAPDLFDRFRERRTSGQRRRSAIRRADVARQRVLLFGARVKRRMFR
jgi:hypothetical protein